MEKEEKIKVAITAGVVAVILLILVLFLALSGNKGNDEERLNDNISEYASLDASNEQNANSGSLLSKSENEDSSLLSGSNLSSEGISSTDSLANNSASINNATSKLLSNDVSGNSFYPIKSAVLKNVYKGLSFDIESQLFEMYTYWNNGNVDAVSDLAHLERFEAMSYKLSGTHNYYYYGDTNEQGIPDGMGLAVYADDQYYYGQWKDGKRNGSGTWINFYPEYSNYVVTEHMYSGAWEDDVPSGEGQEHFDYDQDMMNADDIYLQNAIGSFTSGKFDGNMYILTIDYDGNVEEWYGECDNGTWLQVDNTRLDKKGRIPVLKKANEDNEFIYMTETGTKNQSVKGIISSGSIAK